MSVSTKVDVSGPLFSGAAGRAVEAWLDEAKQEVAQEGVNDVQARLGMVLKHPTGFYESNIVTDLAVHDALITDNDVVYGPWLEGVSSMNDRTRFKGYATFRRTTDELDGKAAGIAEALLRRTYLRRMQ